MLPSSGYFKSSICPFFKSGLCERPHCHFKHTRTVPSGTGSTSFWSATEVEDLSFNIDKKPEVLDFFNTDVSNIDSLSSKVIDPPTYNPTPVGKRNVTTGILKIPSKTQDVPPPSIPEYKPTPISQLKQVTVIDVPDYPPPQPPEVTFIQSVSTRKRRKVVEEYNPEEVRYSKKRVSFNLPEDNLMIDNVAVKNEIFTVESSDEEDLHAGEAPTFSEDEFDDDEKPELSKVKVEPKEKNFPVASYIEEDIKPVIDKFSLVDKILVDVTQNEEFIRGFKKPVKVASILDTKTSVSDQSFLPKEEISSAIFVKSEIIENESSNIDDKQTGHEQKTKCQETSFENKLLDVDGKQAYQERKNKRRTSSESKSSDVDDKQTDQKHKSKRRTSSESKTADVTDKQTNHEHKNRRRTSSESKSTDGDDEEPKSKRRTSFESKLTEEVSDKQANEEHKNKKHISDSKVKTSKVVEKRSRPKQEIADKVIDDGKLKTSNTATKTERKEKTFNKPVDKEGKPKEKMRTMTEKSSNKSSEKEMKESTLNKPIKKDDKVISKTEKEKKKEKHSNEKSAHKHGIDKMKGKSESSSSHVHKSKSEHRSSHCSESKDSKNKEVVKIKIVKDKVQSYSSKVDVKSERTESSSGEKKKHNSKGEKSDKQRSDSSKSRSSESVVKKVKSSSKDFESSSSSSRKEFTKIQDEKVSSSSVVAKKDALSDAKLSRSHSESKSKSSLSKIEKTTNVAKKADHSSTHSHTKVVKEKISKPNAPTSSSHISKSSMSSLPKTVEECKSPEKSDSDADDVPMPVSDYDSDDTAEECWRIFNEANHNNNNTSESSKVESREEEAEHNSLSSTQLDILQSKKKRLAHQASFQRSVKPPAVTPAKAANPTQIMHDRYRKLQDIYNRKTGKKEPNMFSNASTRIGEGHKKQIASVPNADLVNAVLQRNKNLTSTYNPLGSYPVSHTVATTQKGTKRVAHVPAVVTKPRPIIPNGFGNRVPSNIRQKCLNSFIDECLKFCLTEDEAYEMALEQEKAAYERCTSKTVYMNVAANALNKLRHRAREDPSADALDSCAIPTVSSTTNSSDGFRKKMSHERVLAGARAENISYSIEKKKYKPPELILKGISLYKALEEFVLTEEQLTEHGFPMPHETEPGRAVISGIYASKYSPISSDSSKRVCSRCQKTYYVNAHHEYLKEEECDFHWGRLYKRRIAGQFEARYTCCSSDAESEGCCVGPGHVFEGFDTHLLKGFVRTLPKSPPPDGYFGVYSLDCEMCYTSVGIELTRVTVISPDLKPIFETFVKPEHRVLDYNTRFSGIKEEDLACCTTSIRDVQAILLCMFNDKTILIGHSLESDLKALKLIHKTVVDTSVVFPHKLGLPYKRALRTLMAEKCNKIIQNNMEGHDSQEDAAACMELMLWKLREDAKCPR